MTWLKWFVPAVLILTLTGCGGGGTANNPPDDPQPQPQALQQAAVTKGNAGALMGTSFTLMTFSRDVTYDLPYLAYLILLDTGGGAFSETYECSNPTGTTSMSGNLSAIDGSGEIVITDTQCLDSQDGYRTDGVIRIAISETDDDFYPTRYTIHYDSYEGTSTAENYKSVIDGDIKVTPAAGNTQVVSSNIRVDFPVRGEYIEADPLTAVYAVSSGYYPYPEDIQVSGKIANSEIGTVNLSSGASIAEYLRLAGAQDTYVRVAFLDEEHFVAALDANGDTVPEAYLHAAVDDLYEDYGENDLPVVIMNDTWEGEQDSVTSIPLLDVTDADCDFLFFSVSLATGPTGSRLDWSIDNNMNLLLGADKPGDYVINLTVNDGYGGITQEQINLRILLGIPRVELEQTTFDLGIGDLFEIDLSPGNADQGPFTYEVSPAVPGMTISSEGLLRWQTSSLDYYFPNTTVEIEVRVSNADREAEIPLTFSIADPDLKHPVVRSGIEVPNRERNIHVGDFDNDGIMEILLTDNRNLIYTLEWNGVEYVQDWVYPYEINSSEGLISAILPLDLDHDGLYEIFVQTGSEIKSISRNSNRIVDCLDFSGYLQPNNQPGIAKGMAAGDLDNNGSIELVALFDDDYGRSSRAYVIDPATFEILWQISGPDLGNSVAVGNVDTDSSLEIVFAGGYVYDGLTRVNEWVYSEAFGTYVVVADIDGSSVEKIIALRDYATTVVYDAVLKTALFDFEAMPYRSTLTTANLDDDPQKEIIVGSSLPRSITAFNADSGSATEIWSVSAQGYDAVSLAVGDADQDGNIEVIWGTGIGSTGEDSLVVFDSVNQSVDFRNLDPSQLDGPFRGGRKITAQNGDSAIVFAVPETDSGYGGSRFVTIDPETGAMTLSSEVSDTATGNFSFCVADYDLDGDEEVLFASSQTYTGYLSAYDLFRDTVEWFVSGGDAYGVVASGDVNGDGHPDLLTILGSTIRLFDLYHETLLWNSIQLTETPVRIALHDLDDDGVPEILVLSLTKLVIYARNGSMYVEDAVFTDAGLDSTENMRLLLVEDVDGDLDPEIIITRNDSTYSETSQVLVLDANLNVEKSFRLSGRVSAITTGGEADNTLLVATYERPGSDQGGERSFLQLVDLNTAIPVWRSPMLLGEVAHESLHVFQMPGSPKKRLTIGTQDAMYITQ